MLMVESPPQYLHPAPSERGETFALAFSDYRNLCCHSLALLHSFADSEMAIRRSGQTTCVDLWFDRRCLTIELNGPEKTLQLFASDIDSPSAPLLLFAGDTSKASWQQLKQVALGQR